MEQKDTFQSKKNKTEAETTMTAQTASERLAGNNPAFNLPAKSQSSLHQWFFEKKSIQSKVILYEIKPAHRCGLWKGN